MLEGTTARSRANPAACECVYLLDPTPAEARWSEALFARNVLLRRWVLVGSDLERCHLQKQLQHVDDAVVFGWLAVVAEELTSNNLCSEVGELDSHG